MDLLGIKVRECASDS